MEPQEKRHFVFLQLDGAFTPNMFGPAQTDMCTCLFGSLMVQCVGFRGFWSRLRIVVLCY